MREKQAKERLNQNEERTRHTTFTEFVRPFFVEWIRLAVVSIHAIDYIMYIACILLYFFTTEWAPDCNANQ